MLHFSHISGFTYFWFKWKYFYKKGDVKEIKKQLIGLAFAFNTGIFYSPGEE